MKHWTRTRPIVAAVAALSVVLDSTAPLAAAASQTAAAKPVAQKTAAAPATLPVDGGWPREYPLPSGGGMIVYQPQTASWAEQRHLIAFSAVSYRAAGADKPILGTIKLEADTTVAMTERLVSFQKMRIAEANFQTLPRESIREIAAAIDQAIPNDDRIIALDRVLANLDKSSILAKTVEGIKADPPPVFFSKTPAVIVNLDGEPIWSPIKGNDLKFAVNTNWDLFQHAPSNTFYLLHGGAWLKAADVKGPWRPAGALPASFQKLPAEDNWKDVKAALPGKTLSALSVPKVFVSLKPGELILLAGEPRYVPVHGTPLQWVRNTESDLFRMGTTGLVYYLVAGRWFSAPDFAGPWTFATPSLPPDFKNIPLEHERSRVLASVPGTDQAAEAVIVAQIPQTARVNKKALKAPDVAFQGDPQFQRIEPTAVQRAVNTDKDVFLIAGSYYMCYQGVWFVGTSATGPWEVAQTVPQEIYKIPASSPASHVTYVTVEDDNDTDEWVTFAAAAGYTGLMIGWGCTVWGSGWYYPPYYGVYGGYPYYYGHFPTYGYSAWYNPWTGGYGRSAGVYGPYGGAGVAARYNPRTGTYARGAAAYGPYGARGVAQAYNPRTGAVGSTRQGSSVYGSWGQTGVRRGDDWATTSRVTNRATGTTTRTARTSEGGAAVTRNGPGGNNSGVARTGSGDVYAGRDGNVYRKQDGSWQQYGGGGDWNSVDQPTPQQRDQAQQRADDARSQAGSRSGSADAATMGQLNRDSAARAEGAQRTRDASSSGARSGSSGSYRPSGGGGAYRGGGGRRR